MSAKAGVDAVKFQSFRGLDIVSPKVRADEYPGWDVRDHEYWYQFLDSIALPLEDHQVLINSAHSHGLDFITTPVSPSIVNELESMQAIDAYKLASMDLNNLGLIQAIAETEKKVIISTGMADLAEVEHVVSTFGEDKLTIMHCISDYPLDPVNASLHNIKVLQDKFPAALIGFSDHSLGHELVIAAVTLGANIIEKHVTLDRNDNNVAEHHFSMEPEELNDMVKWVRTLDINLQHDAWIRSPNEAEGRTRARRSFHYKRELKAGHILTENELTFIRPGDGIGYDELASVLGYPLRENRDAYAPCMISDIKELI